MSQMRALLLAGERFAAIWADKDSRDAAICCAGVLAVVGLIAWVQWALERRAWLRWWDEQLEALRTRARMERMGRTLGWH